MAPKRILTLAGSAIAALLWTASLTQAGVSYQDPAGGWVYTYGGAFNPGVADGPGGGIPDYYVGGTQTPDGFGGWTGPANARVFVKGLDGTWLHDQGDKWDGTAPGDPLSDPTVSASPPISLTGKQGTSPGGAGRFTEGSTDYIRIQDAGNPDSHGWIQGLTDPNVIYPTPKPPFGEPINTNRRVTFGHDMVLEDGVADELVMTNTGITVSFRARIPNSGPLDDVYLEDGITVSPWLQETTQNELPITNGRGAPLSNNRGMINIVQNGAAQDDTLVGFSLVNSTDVADFKAANGSGSLTTAGTRGGLIMNNLNGNAPSNFIDSESAGTLNMLEMDDSDLSGWNEFWITLENNAGLPGNIEVNVYMNGSITPDTFQVTLAAAGNSNYAGEDNPFLEIGLGDNAGYGAFDMDFLSYKIGVHAPVMASETADRDNDGDVDGLDFLDIQRNDPSLITLWQTQYGTTSANASLHAVPEPGSLLLLLIGSLGVAAGGRRR